MKSYLRLCALLPTVLMISLFSGCITNAATVSLNVSATNQVKTTFLQKIKNYLFSSRLYALDLGGGVIVTDFRVSIERVKFKLDINTEPDEIYFVGPYIVDLLDGNDPLTQALGETEIPPDEYTGIRLIFHKTKDVSPAHPLYDRSIYVAGTISGTPFKMWHDTSENFDIDPPGGITITAGSVNEITLDFKLGSLLSGIDLSGATDTNVNGVIEIDPDGTDSGNESYAQALKESIKNIADLLD